MLHHLPACLACAAMALAVRAAGQQSQPLWQIGQPGGSTRQFALGPGGHAQYPQSFPNDVFYVVGRSQPDKDWPYVQPGPSDAWAGAHSHTSAVCFGLAGPVPAGSCRLVVTMADTHPGGPPRVTVDVNGQTVQEVQLPTGGSDDSVGGNPAAGRPSRFEVEFSAGLLREGTNVVSLTSTNGSWFLYDSVTMTGPAGLRLTTPTGARMLQAVTQSGLYPPAARPTRRVRATAVAVDAVSEAELRIDGKPIAKTALRPGLNRIEAQVPEPRTAATHTLELVTGGQTVGKQEIKIVPERRWTIYLLPHSHNDIGYTDLQSNIEKKQMNNIARGIALARETQDYPAGSRYHWNVEVLWATESYMNQSPEKAQEVVQAVKSGWLGLDALYLNELTGLCRPEELLRLTSFAAKMRRLTGAPIDSAMISDVPGLSWGVVAALSHAGVRYISDGVNISDRIGSARAAWDDKPFYWLSPSGRERVLVWTPHNGYSMSHFWGHLTKPETPDRIFAYLDDLAARNYPYDIACMRWSGFGDNAEPDTELPAFVKKWNEEHLSPRIVIATTRDAFKALEAKYASQIPSYQGDFTPYWEDGAGSSAAETALNRQTADRLSQTEAIWAMRAHAPFPTAEDYAAWRGVLFYDEHTWGAYNSVSEPDLPFVKDQWAVKQGYALDADRRSHALLEGAVATTPAANRLAVYNTSNWQRTDVVIAPAALTKAGDRVLDAHGQAVPSQRLTTGELAFLATEVPAFGSAVYSVEAGAAPAQGSAGASGNELHAGNLTVALDPATGAIRTLRASDGANLVQPGAFSGLNEYLYLPGGDLKDLKRAGTPSIQVGEKGPLVASLVVKSEAPGCRAASTEIRVYDGLGRVDIHNTLDKLAVRAVEGGHIAFPFAVPAGQVRLDVQYTVVRPEIDQIPGACKNWFSVARWADVSNETHGVTWATLDAPLVEVGGITANLPRSQPDPYRNWLQKIEPTQTLCSWIFNNHWHTNYRADQEGPLTFRYSVLPHGAYDPMAAARFGVERSQPLLVTATDGKATPPRLRVSPESVLVTALKPSDDGKGWIVRLYGSSGKDQKVKLDWGEPLRQSLSDNGEQPGKRVGESVTVPAWGIVTVRADR